MEPAVTAWPWVIWLTFTAAWARRAAIGAVVIVVLS
jgi:hypothetical protein